MTVNTGSLQIERRILDTNIYYYLAQGKYSIDYFKTGCKHLVLTAINIYEIIASIKPEDFEFKKDILFNFSQVTALVSDPDDYLREIWEMKVNPDDIGLSLKVASRIFKARSFLEIKEIVEEMAVARKSIHEQFNREIMLRIENISPGYLEAKRRGKRQFSLKFLLFVQNWFRQKHDESVVKNAVLLATRDSVLRSDDIGVPTFEERAEYAEKMLKCYVMLYAEYFTRCLDRLPEENDWDDLALLKYVREDCQFVTAEKKWLSMAKEKGLGHLVVHPDSLNKN